MDESDVIIASSPVDAGISCWKFSTGEELLRHRGCASPPHGLICVAQRFLASSQALGPNSSSGSILYWSWNKPQPQVRSFPAEPIKPIVASADGGYIIGGGAAGNIYVWEVDTGKLLTKWHAHYRGVTSLVWQESSSRLVSGSEDGTVRIWSPLLLLDAEQREEAEQLYEYSYCEHSLPVTDIACSAIGDNAIIVSASEDRTCKVWNTYGNLLRSISFPTIIDAIVLHPGEEVFYAGGRDGKIYIAALSAECGSGRTYGMHIIGALPDHGKAVRCLAFDSKKGYLISGSEDGIIRVWDTQNSNIVRILKHGKGPVNNLIVVRSCGSNPIPLLIRQVSSRKNVIPLPPPLEKYENEETVAKTIVSLPTTYPGYYCSRRLAAKQAAEIELLSASIDGNKEMERLKEENKKLRKMWDEVRRFCVDEILDDGRRNAP